MASQPSSELIIGVLGPGRFGKALARGLGFLGYQVVVKGREGGTQSLAGWVSGCQVLCLAVRDDQLIPLVPTLADTAIRGKTVLIHSGTTPLSILNPLAERGAVTGKFHPLQAFTHSTNGTIPQGTPFAAEGPITSIVEPWVKAWSGSLHHLEGDQWAVYHLAAVLAANFLPLFIRAGATLLEPLEQNRQDALDWLRPLVQTTVEAALDGNNPLPFSGPAIRGDLGTIEAQAQLLEQLHPELSSLYRQATGTILEQGKKLEGS